MATITLTEANDGKAIRVREGDEIVLELPQNASGGYRWHIARADGLDEKERRTRGALKVRIRRWVAGEPVSFDS